MIKQNKNFLLGFLFCIIFAFFSIKDDKNKKSETLNLTAQFNLIDGISYGSEIRMSGLEIGIVSEIGLIKNKPVLNLEIKKNTLIPIDSSISIQTDGLFGSKFLSIEPGGEKKMLKSSDSFLYSEDSILIEDLLQKIIKLGDSKMKGKLL